MAFNTDSANRYIEKNKNKVNPKHRLSYHLMPPIGWMNDPNGLVYFQGLYHVFYQYNPYDSVWGPMHWGHATSEDLLFWKHLPVALSPDQNDEEGCFSGGAIAMGDRLLTVYTSHKENGGQLQTQSLAYSEDGVVFNKYPGNPILEEKDLPTNASKHDFRDPNPIMIRGKHYLLVGSTTQEGVGQILIYRTDDFLNYEYLNRIGPHPYFGIMAECPDMFELDGRIVLIASAQHLEQEGERFKNVNSSLYAIGDFDEETGAFTIETIDEIDLGHHFYAPQTLYDGKRRIMAAWMEMWDTRYLTHDLSHGWNGALTIPRTLRLEKDRLMVEPIGLESLRNDEIVFDGISEKKSIGTIAKRAEIILETRASNDFSLVIRGKEDQLEIGLETKVVYIDPSGLSLAPLERRSGRNEYDGTVRFHVLMDTSSIEVFVDHGREVFTSRIYFEEEELEVHVTGDDPRIERMVVHELKGGSAP
ncbi:MAG: glycoside hydrolase family 32 protein [Acholeplasmataceae bacterium]